MGKRCKTRLRRTWERHGNFKRGRPGQKPRPAEKISAGLDKIISSAQDIRPTPETSVNFNKLLLDLGNYKADVNLLIKALEEYQRGNYAVSTSLKTEASNLIIHIN